MNENLQGYLNKRLQTLMIGALAAIETEMQEDIGLNCQDKDDHQLKLNEKFQKIRSKILELGNQQIKKVGMELKLYKIKGPYYKYNFEAREIRILNDQKDRE